MNKTPIEWTDYTVNPFRFRNLETGKVGHFCTKISPGCKNCYSSKMQAGPYLSGLTFIEENKSKGEFFLDEHALQQVLRRKKPARIFWCDMTDMFLEDYPDEWIDRCFAVMALTPHLTHQVLTKRAKRMREYLSNPDLQDRLTELYGEEGWQVMLPLQNVHLGVSVEDPPRADERIPELLATPAAVHWVSYEPALAAVDFKRYVNPHERDECGCGDDWQYCPLRSRLDWIVVGGESGPGARPFDLAWARQTIAQCKAAGVACFVKQLGADPREGDANGNCRNVDCTHPDCAYIRHRLKNRKGGNPEEWPTDLRVRELPEARLPEARI